MITDLRNRIAEFEDALSSGRLVQAVIRDNEAYIAEMNSEEQLYMQGVNRLGVSIMDYMPYSPETIAIKREKGQPVDRVTLRDTGDFGASFHIEAGSDGFEIKASDWKTEGLLKKYGRQILGLTAESLSELTWEYIYPKLIEERRKYVYGK